MIFESNRLTAAKYNVHYYNTPYTFSLDVDRLVTVKSMLCTAKQSTKMK